MCGRPSIKPWVLHSERIELYFTSGYKYEAFVHLCGPQLDTKKKRPDGLGQRWPQWPVRIRSDVRFHMKASITL